MEQGRLLAPSGPPLGGRLVVCRASSLRSHPSRPLPFPSLMSERYFFPPTTCSGWLSCLVDLDHHFFINPQSLPLSSCMTHSIAVPGEIQFCKQHVATSLLLPLHCLHRGPWASAGVRPGSVQWEIMGILLSPSLPPSPAGALLPWGDLPANLSQNVWASMLNGSVF